MKMQLILCDAYLTTALTTCPTLVHAFQIQSEFRQVTGVLSQKDRSIARGDLPNTKQNANL